MLSHHILLKSPNTTARITISMVIHFSWTEELTVRVQHQRLVPSPHLSDRFPDSTVKLERSTANSPAFQDASVRGLYKSDYKRHYFCRRRCCR